MTDVTILVFLLNLFPMISRLTDTFISFMLASAKKIRKGIFICPLVLSSFKQIRNFVPDVTLTHRSPAYLSFGFVL